MQYLPQPQTIGLIGSNYRYLPGHIMNGKTILSCMFEPIIRRQKQNKRPPSLSVDLLLIHRPVSLFMSFFQKYISTCSVTIKIFVMGILWK